jgi:hypothetical protein
MSLNCCEVSKSKYQSKIRRILTLSLYGNIELLDNFETIL